MDNPTITWLERIGPDYVWILRYLYGPMPATTKQLAAALGTTDVTIKSRRDQALYLLGHKTEIYKPRRTAAEHRLTEFRLRQRLVYLRDAVILSPGDREMLDLALVHGANPYEIAKVSRWTEREARHWFDRLTGRVDLKWHQPGEKIRRAAFRELLKGKTNPKARIELETLRQLSNGMTLTRLAEEWSVPQNIISTLTREVRRELANHRSTRADFTLLSKKASERGHNGTHGISWVNSEMLPLYRRFRRVVKTFSPSELRYLRLRISGRGITHCAREVFDLAHPPGSTLDRAFLDVLREEPITFPDELPLPPFTRQQNEFIENVRYLSV